MQAKREETINVGVGLETILPFKKSKNDGNIVLYPNLSLLKTGYRNFRGGEFRVNYLSLGLPICLEAFSLSSTRKEGVIFGAGPFINFAVNGKFKIDPNDFKSMSFGNSTNDNRKGTDAGFLLKAALRTKKLYMGMQYNIGLTNVIPKDRISNDSYIKTRNIQFYLSYAIIQK